MFPGFVYIINVTFYIISLYYSPIHLHSVGHIDTMPYTKVADSVQCLAQEYFGMCFEHYQTIGLQMMRATAPPPELEPLGCC